MLFILCRHAHVMHFPLKHWCHLPMRAEKTARPGGPVPRRDDKLNAIVIRQSLSAQPMLALRSNFMAYLDDVFVNNWADAQH